MENTLNRLADAEQTVLTGGRHVGEEHVAPNVLTKRVGSTWVCSVFSLLGSSDGFFNKGFATAVLKSDGTVPEASDSFRML